MLGVDTDALALPVGCPIAFPRPQPTWCSTPAPPAGDGAWERTVRWWRARAAGAVRAVGRRVGQLDRDVRALADAVPGVRFLIDTGHVVAWGGDLLELLPFAAHVQLRDARAGRGPGRRRARATSTSPRCSAGSSALGYDGALSVEYFDLPEHGWPCADPADASRSATCRSPDPTAPAVCAFGPRRNRTNGGWAWGRGGVRSGGAVAAERGDAGHRDAAMTVGLRPGVGPLTGVRPGRDRRDHRAVDAQRRRNGVPEHGEGPPRRGGEIPDEHDLELELRVRLGAVAVADDQVDDCFAHVRLGRVAHPVAHAGVPVDGTPVLRDVNPSGVRRQPVRRCSVVAISWGSRRDRSRSSSVRLRSRPPP